MRAKSSADKGVTAEKLLLQKQKGKETRVRYVVGDETRKTAGVKSMRGPHSLDLI